MYVKKNKIKILIFTISVILMSCSMVFAVEYPKYAKLCSDYNNGFGSVARIVGYVVLLAKWLVPLILIVFGMIDFTKAVISSDDNAINKSVSSLIRRIIAGVVVFFVPTIVLAFLNLIEITGNIENITRFGACTRCILNASKYCPID